MFSEEQGGLTLRRVSLTGNVVLFPRGGCEVGLVLASCSSKPASALRTNAPTVLIALGETRGARYQLHPFKEGEACGPWAASL